MFFSNCGTALLLAANLCHTCGRSLDQEQTSQMGESEVADNENESTVNDSVKDLFHRGYPYNEIVGRLSRRRYLSLGPNFCWDIDGIHNLLFMIRLFF